MPKRTQSKPKFPGVQNLIKLRSQNPGFQTDDVLMASLFPKPDGYKALDNATYYRQMIERLDHLPGVVAAAISEGAPITTYEPKISLAAGGDVSGKASFVADLAIFSPRAFDALGMEIEQGRDFSWSDDEHAPRVAIVSQKLAKELFPKGDAVGGHVTVEQGDAALGHELEIIGIVNHATMWNLRRPDSPELYLAALQSYIQWGDLLIRTNIGPARANPERTSGSRRHGPRVRRASEAAFGAHRAIAPCRRS